MKKVKSITLGCRFNFYESEVAKGIVKSLNPKDDVVIVNTCSVTHEAERQSKQAVRKAIKENPDAKIIVTGCAAKTSDEYFSNLEGVFKVIQNENKSDVIEYNAIPHMSETHQFDENSCEFFDDRSRAFLQIQNGCNHFCTYCIVPFTRGRSRSLPLEQILKRVGRFVELGFKEIVLSGIDITSYGEDLDDSIDLADVIEAILNRFDSLQRLRISSIDPKGINDRLFYLMTEEKRIMPHFHLSIQSGDNDVLRFMRRRHTREEVIKICNRILEIRPEVVFGSDFIAGFPMETESMFENTLKLIDEAHLSLMHCFPYSPRSGTVAAGMIQLPSTVIHDRSRRLREKSCDAKRKLMNSLIGKKITGIVEKVENGISFGKTDTFLHFKLNENHSINEIVSGNVTCVDDNFLICSK